MFTITVRVTDTDSSDPAGFHGCALAAACAAGLTKVAVMMMEEGACVNAPACQYVSALHATSQRQCRGRKATEKGQCDRRTASHIPVAALSDTVDATRAVEQEATVDGTARTRQHISASWYAFCMVERLKQNDPALLDLTYIY
jgi:hypothetical protein